MHRRSFITALGGGIGAAPLAARAQPTSRPDRIGILEPAGPPGLTSEFRARLADLGWTVRYEPRYAEGRPERFADLAADLARVKVSLILTLGTHATKAAKDATGTIPIVFVGVASPINARLVASLARPGGNVTGATDQLADLATKVLQLISEIAPTRTRIGVLEDFTNPSESDRGRGQFDRLARERGLTIARADVRAPEDVDAAFRTLARERTEALIVGTTPALVFARERVARLAAQNRLPTIGYGRGWIEAGLLMSYYPSFSGLLRQAADYADRIFRGAAPADLPVVQPTRFELLFNLKTAKAIGLKIPPSLLARADQLVE